MENKFIDGLFFNKPHENAPAFVKGNIKIQADKFIEYLKNNTDYKGYISIDLLESKEGKYYALKNEWKPQEQPQETNNQVKAEDLGEVMEDEINVENIPF